MRLCHLIVLPVFLAFFSLQASSVEVIQIISNTDFSTKYYQEPDLSSPLVGEFAPSEKFNPALPVLEKKDGFIQFEKNGVKSWVLLRNINASRQLRIEETCGAMPTEKFKKNVASTRGVGEPCKQN